MRSGNGLSKKGRRGGAVAICAARRITPSWRASAVVRSADGADGEDDEGADHADDDADHEHRDESRTETHERGTANRGEDLPQRVGGVQDSHVLSARGVAREYFRDESGVDGGVG